MATKSKTEKPKESLTGSGRMPRNDPAPAWEELDVPSKLRVVVKLQKGVLAASCSSIKGATRYDWQLRRGPGSGFSDEHSTNVPNTEFTGYPLGPVGVPECRVRAVAANAISGWSEWVPSAHDLGDIGY